MLNNEELLLSSIELTEGQERYFTDLDLAKKLNVSRSALNRDIEKNTILSNLFDKIKKSKMKCDVCNKEVNIYPGLKKAYCKCGNTLDEKNIPYWDYGIKNKEIESYFIDKLANSFEMVIREKNKIILKVKDKYISVLLTSREAHLEDYFLLRGWSQKGECYIVISCYYDFALSSFRDKSTDLYLLNLANFLKSDIEKLLHEIISLIEERQKEEKNLLKFEPEKEDLSEVQKLWETIIDELPKFALQAGDENAKVQGDKFENHVINLLGLTIFDARHIGGQDNTDGIIVLYFHCNTKRNCLYPVEVKSFKPKDGKKFCRIKDYEDQLRRYLKAYISDAITQHFTVKSLLIVSYDFDLENTTDQNVIKKIKTDYGVDIILMPLHSLTHLVRVYYEKKISSIDNEIVEEILSNKYITEEHVDKALEQMKIRAERATDHIIKSAKEHIRRTSQALEGGE